MNSFKFDEVVNFDEHIRLSIPNYDTLFDIFIRLAEHFQYYGDKVIDIGCSTGNFLSSMDKGVICTGIDTINIIPKCIDFNFKQVDAIEYLRKQAGDPVIVSMFFLQFLGKEKRRGAIKEIRRLVERGGTLLIAEKIELDCTKLQTLIHRMHISDKRKHFTDKEILDKDEQLANSMYCLTESELIEELDSIGKHTRVWQSYNFVGYVVRGER